MRHTASHRILAAAALVAIMVIGASVAGAHWRPLPRRVVIVAHAPRPVHKVVLVAGRPAGVIDFNVKPKATRIFVDGSYRGTCDEFDGHPQKMALKPGRHHIRLVTPSGEEVARTVQVVAGYELELNLKL